MPILLECSYCRQAYFAKPSRLGKSKYCSRLCQNRAIAPRGQKCHLWTGAMVKVRCQRCDKEFTTKKSRLARGQGKFCSRECAFKGRRDYHGQNNPFWKNGQVERTCENCERAFMVKRALVKLGRGRFCSQKCLKGSLWWRTLQAQRIKETGLIEKMAKGLQAKPNKPESKLMSILDAHFPNKWEFNNGQLILNGLIPDFINVDGQKALIELFGDYWHGHTAKWHRTELGRIMAYNSVGFRCLVIWDHELNEEIEVVKKITQFCKKGGVNENKD